MGPRLAFNVDSAILAALEKKVLGPGYQIFPTLKEVEAIPRKPIVRVPLALKLITCTAFA